MAAPQSSESSRCRGCYSSNCCCLGHNLSPKRTQRESRRKSAPKIHSTLKKAGRRDCSCQTTSGYPGRTFCYSCRIYRSLPTDYYLHDSIIIRFLIVWDYRDCWPQLVDPQQFSPFPGYFCRSPVSKSTVKHEIVAWSPCAECPACHPWRIRIR